MQGTGNIFKSLTSCLHDVYVLTLLIIHIHCFYYLKIILLSSHHLRKLNHTSNEHENAQNKYTL